MVQDIVARKVRFTRMNAANYAAARQEYHRIVEDTPVISDFVGSTFLQLEGDDAGVEACIEAARSAGFDIVENNPQIPSGVYETLLPDRRRRAAA